MILTEGEQSSFFSQSRIWWMCWSNYVDRMQRSEFCLKKEIEKKTTNENSGCAPVEGNKELKFAKGADVLMGKKEL